MKHSNYIPSEKRYNNMIYRFCGSSGLALPVISLGLWHNFGYEDNFTNSQNIICSAFDAGISHFDLANNYGQPYGSAEENFGKILKSNLAEHRDELIISTKAGYDMWKGPYGTGGSRKHLIASCDQSLKRLGLEYVDIFYSHRFDVNTPIDETMLALDQIIRQGKALYVGISNYNPEQTHLALDILESLGTPGLVHQLKYSMFERTPEEEQFSILDTRGVGAVAYSPLAQGLLTDRYLKGIPLNSRMAKSNQFLTEKHLTEKVMDKIRRLHSIAEERNQTLAQMAIAWILREPGITSVLVGASSSQQLKSNIDSINRLEFSEFELNHISEVLNEQ